MLFLFLRLLLMTLVALLVGILLLLLRLRGVLARLLLVGAWLLLLLFLLAGILWRLVLRHFHYSFRLAGKQGLLTLVSSIADERRL
ncbi:hypothetical protein [Comamonas jiangduensis]|uniref:hypothetical protein n=1 Tax=Comamonas jiangduensis TaxID=1194168 RepID=UPI0028A629E3|nr:hypothetical protein [Comamonas jiangduensis]